MCFLRVIGKLSPSSSLLKVDGLCGIEQESSEFSLAFPTKHGYKFEIYQHIDPCIIESELEDMCNFIIICMYSVVNKAPQYIDISNLVSLSMVCNT